MFKRIFAVGVCIFALMVVIKDGRVLRTTGLTGSCSVVQTFTDSSELAACRAGQARGAARPVAPRLPERRSTRQL